MSGMDNILQINGKLTPFLNGLYYNRRNLTEADGDMTCQSGARWEQINETLKEKGIPLFFPVRPLIKYSNTANLIRDSLIQVPEL